MSKLEEIREAMEYFSKPVGLWDTAELVKHKQPLINLARLILESASVMPKEPKCGKSYPSCVVCPYNEDCETYEKILIIEQCTIAHTRIVMEKDSEIEQLRVQLAGCGVEALGYGKDKYGKQVEKGDYAWSASLGDVRRLREKYEQKGI